MKNRDRNINKNFISVVAHIHNPGEAATVFSGCIAKILKDNFEKYEIICVNDASTDDSAIRVKEIAKQLVDTTVTILNMSYFHGLELAMTAGVDLAIGDFVFEFDQIGIDYPMDTLMKVYDKSLMGYDIVSAAVEGKKRLSSNLFYRIFNNSTKYQYQLRTETFRILSRRAINRTTSMNKTIPYQKPA